MPHAPQCGVKRRREVRLWVWSFAGVRPLIDATFNAKPSGRDAERHLNMRPGT